MYYIILVIFLKSLYYYKKLKIRSFIYILKNIFKKILQKIKK